MHKVNLRGVEIAYGDYVPEKMGQGAPILLIHGFASNAQVNWVDTGWVKFLNNAGYRVIALDNRGHGQSEKFYDSSRYLAPEMAEDSFHLLEHLKIETCFVMGYSMGARLAAFLTLQHPHCIKAAIFAGLAERMITGVGGAQEIAEALLAPSLDDVTIREARGFRIFADQTKSDRQALAACIKSARVKIKPESIASITCPTLVVAGEFDEISGSVEGLNKMIPGSVGVTLPKRNHMNAVGDANYKQAVLEFLKAA